MKNRLKFSISCMAATFVLGACATSKPALQGHLDPTLGSAVKSNMAQQAVAPTATQKADTFIPADRTRARMARQNYKENKVPEPQRVTTDTK